MLRQDDRQEAEHAMRSESANKDGRGWRLVKTRDFGLLWWGQVTSQVGEGLNKMALLWFVYELTGSAMMLAMVGLIQTIPPLVFGPIIGVYLDRFPKKQVMVWGGPHSHPIDPAHPGTVRMGRPQPGRAIHLDLFNLGGLHGIRSRIELGGSIAGQTKRTRLGKCTDPGYE